MPIQGNNLPKVKRQNRTSIKEVIYKYGPISRSEIADMLSLTPPTITTNVAELISQGLVRECGSESADGDERALGRRPVMIDFIRNAGYVMGAELGPYGTKICLSDLRGGLVDGVELPSAEQDYDLMMQNLADSLLSLIARGGIRRDKLLGVGLGLPGFVESGKGVLRSTRNGWNNRCFAADLEKLIHLPVIIENNARVRAVGVELFSDGLRPETFAYYLISYGIACPLVIRNRILAGESAGAGEVGHMVAELNGPKCDNCGNNGCLEAIASEKAIIKRCADAIKGGMPTMLSDICADARQPTMPEILKAQQSEDRIVCSIMRDAVCYLGVTLANIINFISPRLVIVDGYMMESPQNRKHLLETTRRNLFGLNDKDVEIEFMPYDVFTGAKGAAALAIKEFMIKGCRNVPNAE